MDDGGDQGNRQDAQFADEAAVSILLLAFVVFSGLTGCMLLFRRYVEFQRAQGRTSLCFGCIHLGEAPVMETRTMPNANGNSEAFSNRRLEMLEESSIAALELLPIENFTNQNRSSNEEPECSLCMAPLQEDDTIRKLPCGHIFHLNCVGKEHRPHSHGLASALTRFITS
ncbi:MAG: hypothetical protein SGPRY_014965 [Prymnesium sp.]